jgi:hypothetical protein
MVKTSLILLLLFGLVLFRREGAQSGCQESGPKQDERLVVTNPLERCFDPILRSVRATKRSVFVQRDVGAVRLHLSPPRIEVKGISIEGKSVRAWLAVLDRDSIRVYLDSEESPTYCLLSSVIEGPSGLSTNVTKWLLVDLRHKSAFSYESLSANPEFFYVVTKGAQKAVSCYVFDYSSEFLRDHDYDHFSATAEKVEILAGEQKVLNQKIIRCHVE